VQAAYLGDTESTTGDGTAPTAGTRP